MSGSKKVWRTYTVRFDGRPSLFQLRQELEHAAQAMHDNSVVVVETDGSTNPELEEITLTMENV